MRPLLHASLVNGRLGDPALFVETMFEKRAILFDLGDISLLPPRKIQRLEHVFVSHAHIDHFFGFDRLLRVLVGRAKSVNLYGPEGFVDQVGHKLNAYRWNLVDRFLSDLVFVVTEVGATFQTRTAQFRLKGEFALEALGPGRVLDGVICRGPSFRVSMAALEHRMPCLAFAVEEAAHINVWKSRLAEMGLSVGPWLRDLKRALTENRPDDYPVLAGSQSPACPTCERRLGELRSLAEITAGQKIAYVTDVADTAANRRAIVRLARNADLLFIEAPFANSDAELAVERLHLTTGAAGSIAREAGVRRVEPFHFSPRYAGDEAHMVEEVLTAFASSR